MGPYATPRAYWGRAASFDPQYTTQTKFPLGGDRLGPSEVDLCKWTNGPRSPKAHPRIPPTPLTIALRIGGVCRVSSA